MKKIISLILALCMVTALFVGCGQKPAENKTSEVKKETTVSESKESEPAKESEEAPEDYSDADFRILWWGNETRAGQLTTVIEEFEKAYPGLNITVEYCAFGDYFTKLNTQIAGGDAPDVFLIRYSEISTYGREGLLMDLNDVVADGSLDLSNVADGNMSGVKWDGVLYGVPTGVNASCAIYNKTLLDELGLSISQTPTMSEFIEVSKAVYEKTGVKTMYPDTPEYFRSLGGDNYAKEGNAAGFTAEMLTSYHTEFAKGIEEGWIMRGDDYIEETNAACMINDIYWVHTMTHTNAFPSDQAEAPDLDLGMFALPVADNAVEPNASFIKPNTVWSVSSKTEYPEIAVAFLDYFTNNTFTADTCGTGLGVPISAAVKEHMSANFDDAQIEMLDFLAFLEDGHVSDMNINTPEKAAEAFAFKDELYERVWYGTVKPEDVPAAAQECVDNITKFFESIN